MNRDQAQVLAQRSRLQHAVPSEAQAERVERSFIEVTGADPQIVAPVRDVLVWMVTFGFQQGTRWIELAIDDQNGEVVRVRYSR